MAYCHAMLCALMRRAPTGCGIGQQFLLMVPFLKFYTEYLANYDDALATLTEWARGTLPIRQVYVVVLPVCGHTVHCATHCTIPAEAVPVDPPAHLPVCARVRACAPVRACVRTRACMHASPGG